MALIAMAYLILPLLIEGRGQHYQIEENRRLPVYSTHAELINANPLYTGEELYGGRGQILPVSEYDPALLEKGKAYSFSYDAGDHDRQEVSDHLGNVRGSYSVVEADGTRRRVEYQAGPGMGFVVTALDPPNWDQQALNPIIHRTHPPLIERRVLDQPIGGRPLVLEEQIPLVSPPPVLRSRTAGRRIPVRPRPPIVDQEEVPPPPPDSRTLAVLHETATPRTYQRGTFPPHLPRGRPVIGPQERDYVRYPDARRGRKYGLPPVDIPQQSVSSSTPIPAVVSHSEFGQRILPLNVPPNTPVKPLFTPNQERSIYNRNRVNTQLSTSPSIPSSTPFPPAPSPVPNYQRVPEVSVRGQSGIYPDRRERPNDFPGAVLTGVVVETPVYRNANREIDTGRRHLPGPEIQYEQGKAKRAHNDSVLITENNADKIVRRTKVSHTMKVPKKITTTTAATTTTTTTAPKVPTKEPPTVSQSRNSLLNHTKLESFTILARNGLNTNIHSKASDEMYISKSLFMKIKNS